MNQNFNALFDAAIKTFKAHECHIPNGIYSAIITYMGWKEEEDESKHLLWEFTLEEGTQNGKTVMEEYPLQEQEDIHRLYLDMKTCGYSLSSFGELESLVAHRKLIGQRVKIQLEDEYFDLLEVLQETHE